MAFLLQQLKSDSPSMEQTSSLSTPTDSETVLIQYAFELLELYLETEDSSPLMPRLKQIRNEMLEDLDQVESVKEIYGLMYWLMADYGVDNRGESLEETADRLGDIDIENDTDKYSELIFHLKDAVERLYDLELE
ncbi:hypothetical protein [Neptuniibacter sp.]|uniref:hypothetical protein n=1 Tax=Neptuniibacter sp. TaxID=1962643 RepID=UPI00262B0170|nr:hypothetical protein [Neptuniibacter sp.]MCP4595597.1 hypothetical protein [Neptuniibacter sp.]